MQGNTLGGFLLAHVIGTRCYFDQVVLSSAAAKWPLGLQRRNPVKYARLLGTPTPYLRPGPTDA